MSVALSSVSRNVIYNAQAINDKGDPIKKEFSGIDDIDAKIFTFLPDKSIYNMKAVSRRVKHISSLPLVWNEVIKRIQIEPRTVKQSIRELLYTQSKKYRIKCFKELQKCASDETNIAILTELSQTNLKKSLEISCQITQDSRRAIAYIVIGDALQQTKSETVEQLFTEALKISVMESIIEDERSGILRRLVRAKARIDRKSADKLALKITDSDQRILAHIDAYIFSFNSKILEFADEDQGQHLTLAFEYLPKSYKAACQIDSIYLRAMAFIDIGKAWISIDSKEADKLFNKALEFIDQVRNELKDRIRLGLVKAMSSMRPYKVSVIASQIVSPGMRIASFIENGKALVSSDSEAANQLFDNAFKLIDQSDLPEKVCILRLIIRAKALTRPQEAEEIIRQIAYYTNCPAPVALAFIDIGKALIRNNPEKAANYFDKARSMLPQIQNRKDEVLLELSRNYIDSSVFLS